VGSTCGGKFDAHAEIAAAAAKPAAARAARAHLTAFVTRRIGSHQRR
jgi:hypothetical protein